MTPEQIAAVIRRFAKDIHIDHYDMGERECEFKQHLQDAMEELAAAFEEAHAIEIHG